MLHRVRNVSNTHEESQCVNTYLFVLMIKVSEGGESTYRKQLEQHTVAIRLAIAYHIMYNVLEQITECKCQFQGPQAQLCPPCFQHISQFCYLLFSKIMSAQFIKAQSWAYEIVTCTANLQDFHFWVHSINIICVSTNNRPPVSLLLTEIT